VRELSAAALAHARGAAPDLAAGLAPPPRTTPPDAPARARLSGLIRDYTQGPIATMTVQGRMLAQAFPTPAINR
jgi:hypothetical protein